MGQKLIANLFLAYSVFLSASEKLYLSMATTVEGEKKLEISPFLRQLSQGLKLPIQENEPLRLMSDPENHLGTMRTLLSDLIALNRFAQDENRAFCQLGENCKNLFKTVHCLQWRSESLKVYRI